MDFYDYTFDDDDTILCEQASIETMGNLIAVELRELNPKSLVNMITRWDEDVVEALIRELQKRLKLEKEMI